MTPAWEHVRNSFSRRLKNEEGAAVSGQNDTRPTRIDRAWKMHFRCVAGPPRLCSQVPQHNEKESEYAALWEPVRREANPLVTPTLE